MNLSIVVPLFNEGESVAPLCEAIASALDRDTRVAEILLVDDGSSDATYARACEAVERDSRIRVIKLGRNFGQTAALKAGFETARGDTIVTMDGDLQNDPRDIAKLLQKMDEGYDMVAGWREDRQDRWLSRRVPSQIANWLIRKTTGVPIRDNGCALRAYPAAIIKKYPLYSEMHRLLPTILAMTGARIAEVPVSHHARQYGRSKYGLSRTYKVLFDLVALKTILTLFRLPFFGFGVFALFFLLASVLILVGGALYVSANPEMPFVIFVGASILWGSLGISVLMMGILCDLIYTMGDIKIERLLNWSDPSS